jgi:CDP-glucose 4,6-dehydratase
LRIAIDKAVGVLRWQPRWHLDETVTRTIDWYRDFYRDQNSSMREHSLDDIKSHENGQSHTNH